MTNVAEQEPLTSLEFLRQSISYSPYLFWGLVNDKVLHGSQCNSVIRQYSWQAADQVGRADMKRALYEAEQRLFDELHFSIAPHFAEETKEYLSLNLLSQNAFYSPAQWGAGDPYSRWTGIFLKEGYVNAIGYEDLTLLDTVDIALTDENDDGLLDTFTAIVATSETDPLKIAVYFATADRLDNEDVSEAWRIQPVSVSITGGVATIIGRVWLIVKPILYEKATQPANLDPDDVEVFVSEVAVYTRTTNPNGTDISNAQATLEWETMPFPLAWCNATIPNQYSTDPATIGYAVGRAGIRNPKLGEVLPAQATLNVDTGLWNETFPIWNFRPDRVTVRYNAGYPLDTNGQVNKKLRSAVTDLAIASMPARICACDVANKVLWELQWDLARVQNNLEAYATTQQQLNNIFGTKRGEVSAWRKIKHLVLHRGVTY